MLHKLKRKLGTMETIYMNKEFAVIMCFYSNLFVILRQQSMLKQILSKIVGYYL